MKSAKVTGNRPRGLIQDKWRWDSWPL